MTREEQLEKFKELFRQHQGGRFEVESILGIGGMGVVVRAQDTRLRVARAIKIFNPELLAQTDLVRRFENEATIMAGIDHPNIVKVYDIGEIDHHHFIILEWVDGGSLAGFLEHTGAMHPRVALEMIYRVCDALSVAHQRNVIHRDIKPDNILINSDGVPKVADFGIAHMDDTERKRLTATKEGMGSPGYMAPEQMSELASTDARADVYAVAVTFWSLMTARRPPGMLFFHDIEDSPEILESIPSCLHDILKKAVARKPDGRYSSIATLVTALRGVESQLPEFSGSVVVTITTDEEISVVDPTTLGVTKFALKVPMSLKEVSEKTTVSPKSPPIVLGNTLAYRPSGEAVHEIPLQIDSDRNANVGEGPASTRLSSSLGGHDPPLRTQSTSHRRMILIGVSVLCVVGLVAAFVASSRSPQTVVKQPVIIEQKSLAVVEPEAKHETLDAITSSTDVSIAMDVSSADVATNVESDVLIETAQQPTDSSNEKPLEKKEHKVSKSSRAIEIKAGETLVLKPTSEKSKPPTISDSLKPKPEVVKVQVSLDLPSGDTSHVWLLGPGGKRKIPGVVVPGTYKVVAIFKEDEGEITMPAPLEVKEGESVRLSCNPTFRKCRKL